MPDWSIVSLVANLKELVFRQITPADFFNINKQPGAEDKGGGQSYIDVPIKNVSLATWRSFFSNIEPDNTKSGPLWTIEVSSLGELGTQKIQIGQRRNASVNIRSQKLISRSGNRVFAWHPDHGGFPRAPVDMASAEDPRVLELTAGVRVIIFRTDDDVYWAGWLRTDQIQQLVAVDRRFEEMLIAPAGHLTFDSIVKLDVANLIDPFGTQRHTPTEEGENIPTKGNRLRQNTPYNAKAGRTEEAIADDLFKDDSASEEGKKTQKVIETFDRNRKAVRELKRLYKSCQITGDDFVFSKINGEPYLEVHHLVPLGEGGSDEPANLVVISAHIHRMLHYAVVEGIDFSKIVDNKLKFTINGENFTITWQPEHAKVVAKAGEATV